MDYETTRLGVASGAAWVVRLLVALALAVGWWLATDHSRKP